MSEPTREQIAETINIWWEGTDPDGLMAEDVDSLKADLLALFQQPTPSVVHFAPYGSSAASDGTPLPRSTQWNVTTGEYQDGEPFTVKRDRTTCPDCHARFTAEPVSTADMAPGTTLGIEFRWTVVRDPSGATFLYRDNNGYAQWLTTSDVAPSTIRNVAPPPRD